VKYVSAASGRYSRAVHKPRPKSSIERGTDERVLNAAKARMHFGELLRRVKEQDETVIVDCGGIPQLVVVSIATTSAW
jgi:prevent-host-death family protein